MIRFRCVRAANGAAPKTMGFLTKNVDDEVYVVIDYSLVLDSGDYPTACVLTAVELLAQTTVDETILGSTTGEVIDGALIAGSGSGLMVTNENLSLLGLREGDKVTNITKKWVKPIKSFNSTTLHRDTMVVDTDVTASATADTWASSLVRFLIEDGEANSGYVVEAKTTMASGQIFSDTFVLLVKDDAL